MTAFFDLIIQIFEALFSILSLPVLVHDTLNQGFLACSQFLGSFGFGNINAAKSWEMTISVSLGLILPLLRDIF